MARGKLDTENQNRRVGIRESEIEIMIHDGTQWGPVEEETTIGRIESMGGRCQQKQTTKQCPVLDSSLGVKRECASLWRPRGWKIIRK